MDFSSIRKNPTKQVAGVAAVVALHGLLAYALTAGLARTIVDIIDRPLETRLIAEARPARAAPPPLLAIPPRVTKPPPATPPTVQTAPLAQRVETPTATTPALPPVQASTAAIAATSEPAVSTPVETAPTREQPPSQQPVQQEAAPVRIAAVVDPSACRTPEYPRSSLRTGETGAVTLALLIGTDGRVIDSRIDKSSGFPELDKAARAGLSLCRFKPASVDGKPEESWTKMRYVWKLDG